MQITCVPTIIPPLVELKDFLKVIRELISIPCKPNTGFALALKRVGKNFVVCQA